MHHCTNVLEFLDFDFWSNQSHARPFALGQHSLVAFSQNILSNCSSGLWHSAQPNIQYLQIHANCPSGPDAAAIQVEPVCQWPHNPALFPHFPLALAVIRQVLRLTQSKWLGKLTRQWWGSREWNRFWAEFVSGSRVTTKIMQSTSNEELSYTTNVFWYNMVFADMVQCGIKARQGMVSSRAPGLESSCSYIPQTAQGRISNPKVSNGKLGLFIYCKTRRSMTKQIATKITNEDQFV